MRKHLLIWLFITFALSAFAPSNAGESSGMVTFLQEYLEIKYPTFTFNKYIYVAAKRQKMYLIENGDIISSYSISTAKNGIGSKVGSKKTPEGLHRIAEKVGEGIPQNTIIRQKVATDEKAEIVLTPKWTNLDLITTRVFHLTGMENGKNAGEGCDSYKRGIFIHGTHEEGLLGKPASKGCVRMANKDVIELFENVEVGTFVVILNN
jgi:lipoprotein-anchoring transpeptidase ErfK/SrfK